MVREFTLSPASYSGQTAAERPKFSADRFRTRQPHESNGVSEQLPADLAAFDLVVIDESSQSDITALPAIMRAKNVLIVGDDKQVSPTPIGIEHARFLS
jgi:superfamily I DNA and/or RNA helicase